MNTMMNAIKKGGLAGVKNSINNVSEFNQNGLCHLRARKSRHCQILLRRKGSKILLINKV